MYLTWKLHFIGIQGENVIFSDSLVVQRKSGQFFIISNQIQGFLFQRPFAKWTWLVAIGNSLLFLCTNFEKSHIVLIFIWSSECAKLLEGGDYLLTHIQHTQQLIQSGLCTNKTILLLAPALLSCIRAHMLCTGCREKSAACMWQCN